jgi:hypothetical protein
MHALSYPQIVGRLDDGFIAMLLDHNEDTAPMNVVRRDSAAFLLYDATGRYVKQIARLPGFMRYVTEIRRPGTGRTFRASLSLPYGTPFVYATHGNELVYGAAERYEIAVYDSSGSVRMLIRRAATRGPIDGELVEKYRASRLAAAGDDVDRRRDIEAQLQNLPYPDSLPSYRRFKVDREGMIWVQEYYVAGTAQASWSVFDGEGRWQTDVVMPTSWQIVDIGHDYVLTVETSEMDVERVRLHVLSRGRER